jgi:hypothetical protein
MLVNLNAVCPLGTKLCAGSGRRGSLGRGAHLSWDFGQLTNFAIFAYCGHNRGHKTGEFQWVLVSGNLD